MPKFAANVNVFVEATGPNEAVEKIKTGLQDYDVEFVEGPDELEEFEPEEQEETT